MVGISKMKHLNLCTILLLSSTNNTIVAASSNDNNEQESQTTNHLRGRSLQQTTGRPNIFNDTNNSTTTPLMEPYKEDPFTSNVNDFINTTHTISQRITDTPTTSPSPTVSPKTIPTTTASIPTILTTNTNLPPAKDQTFTTNTDDTDFKEFIAFVGWYAFLILCCILPTICTYYKRRRNAHLLHENISSIRLRLEEMERYNTTTAGVSGRGGGGNEGSVIRLGERDQDWEFLESLFGSSTSGNATANNNTNERAGMAVTIATLGIDGGNDTERRRQIMSDILGGMSVRNVMEREQRRKRERGRRLVSLLKECSLWVKESHLIPKEGVVGGSDEGGMGGGGGCVVDSSEGGEGGDIELGNIHTVQNETETDGVDNKAGEDFNDDEALKSISNQDATVNEGSQVMKSDIGVESPPPMNGRNEEESCQQPTADETSDGVATTANNAPDSTITTLEPTTTSTALQPTDQAVDPINTQSSLLPSAAADNTATTSNNNILSLYQTDDLYDDDDDDDNKYSALCLPCSSTHKDARTTPLSVARSAPPPQSAIGNTEPSTRLVPSTCAICLLSYSPGCYVTWSSNPECIHVFHRDCILVWLLKKEEPLCPCCRREFVSTSALNAETTTTTAAAAAAAEPDNEDSRLEQYRRSIMLLERSQSMASRRRTSSSSGRSTRFARMSLQEPGATSPQWDSVGLGRVRHF